MRAFWELDFDNTIAKALDALIDWGKEFKCLPDDPQQRSDVEAIIARLKLSSAVPEVGAFTASVNALDFMATAKHIGQRSTPTNRRPPRIRCASF